MSAFDGVKVHGESDVVGDENKLNHASAPQKVRSIADCERVGVMKGREVLLHVFFFGKAEKCDGAFSRVGFVEIWSSEPDNAYRTAVDFFARSNIVQRAAERIFADDADIEIGGTEWRAGRNAHELAEVEQVCGFYGVLRGLRLAGKQA